MYLSKSERLPLTKALSQTDLLQQNLTLGLGRLTIIQQICRGPGMSRLGIDRVITCYILSDICCPLSIALYLLPVTCKYLLPFIYRSV